MLFERVMKSAKRNETATLHLLILLSKDLSLMLHEVNLESPLALKLFKNLALHTIHLLCSSIYSAEDQLDHALKMALVDIASDMLLNCQMAQIRASEIKEAKECYC